MPNKSLQQTGHAKGGCARHFAPSRVSRLLSWVFGERRVSAVAGFDGDPYNPILTDPYSWELIEFAYRREADWRETYIDLVFSRGAVERRLRFFGPREVELPRGTMGSWCRVYVTDVTGRQLEDMRVRVGSFEPDWCVPSFWAASVVEVAEPSHAEQVAAADRPRE